MGRDDFITELKALRFAPESRDTDRVCVPFTIPVGRFAGEIVRLGFTVGGDYNVTPPGTLHVSPHLLPINPQNGSHPCAGVHTSPFGADWQYWSRPLNHWLQTSRNAKDVMAHVLRLFETL